LNRLLERYLPRLRRWASGRLPARARDLGDTHDLVQEVVLRAFKNLPKFDHRGEGALQAYLRQAVMNRIKDELRRIDRQPLRNELDTAIPGDGLSPLEQAIGGQAIDRYERALAALSETERQAVVARLELGCSYQEVAVLVEKPTAGAARVAISRALAKLARLMAESRGPG
jgi:RNA polymerase sigma factor (sigma-70 family)